VIHRVSQIPRNLVLLPARVGILFFEEKKREQLIHAPPAAWPIERIHQFPGCPLELVDR
jgi:hypothetical protein